MSRIWARTGTVYRFCGLSVQTAVDWVYRGLICGHKLSAFRILWCKFLFLQFRHKHGETHASRYSKDLYNIQYPLNIQERILHVVDMCLRVAGSHTCSRKHTQVWRATHTKTSPCNFSGRGIRARNYSRTSLNSPAAKFHTNNWNTRADMCTATCVQLR